MSFHNTLNPRKEQNVTLLLVRKQPNYNLQLTFWIRFLFAVIILCFAKQNYLIITDIWKEQCYLFLGHKISRRTSKYILQQEKNIKMQLGT